MTAETTTPSLDATDAALAAATPGLGEDGQRLAAAVLRLLSAGDAVAPAAAAAAGMPESRAGQLLRSWPGVFWDDRGRMTGFWGLALTGMPHRIRHAGTNLHAWCAFDPLFLARAFGATSAKQGAAAGRRQLGSECLSPLGEPATTDRKYWR